MVPSKKKYECCLKRPNSIIKKGKQRPLYKLEFSILDKFDLLQDSFEIDRLAKMKSKRKKSIY